MTTATRETLRSIGSFAPWIMLFVVLMYLAEQQNEYNTIASTERAQRIAYTDSIEDLDGARVVADDAGIIREWNSGMTELFGYTEDDALGREVEFFMPEPIRESHRQVRIDAMENPRFGTVRQFECEQLYHKDGHLVSADVRVRIEKRQGKPVAIGTFVEKSSLSYSDVSMLTRISK